VDARELRSLCRIIADPSGVLSSTDLVERTLASDPLNLAALYLSGFISQVQGDTNAAAKAYERILSPDRYPRFAPAQRQLAILSLERDPQSARALELAQRARVSLPNDPAVLRVLGIVSFHQKDYRGSVRSLNEAIRIHPDDPELRFYLGMAFLKLDDPIAARNALQTALELGLDSAHAVQVNEALARLKQ
jgi:tetratricopeptide (TPR) repeat protein